jgi:hypothetical protein
MSLNDISLPSQLVADLYQHALVGDTATAMPQKKPISFLGKAGKGILIVVNKPDVPYLPDNELSFLTKVLTACQLGLMDVAIVNWSSSQEDAKVIISQFNARSVILFDVEPAQFSLPSDLPMYSVHATAGTKIVVAPSLKEIESSKEAKGQLWAALKELFGV